MSISLKKLKYVIILIITLSTLTGCSDDSCLFCDMDVDIDLGPDSIDAELATVHLYSSCSSSNSPSGTLTYVILSCDSYKELMIDNTPPAICDQITLVDANGTSFTGFYSHITSGCP